MLGAIIGDIVGSIYEVEEIKAINTHPDKKRSYEERITILNNSTPLFISDCSYTDDTVLTTAIASSLLGKKSFEESLREYGLKEIELGKDKYGRSRFGKGFVSWLKKEKVGDSYGNGASMRISPIAYFYDDLDVILSKTKEATIPSHNHEEAILGAQAVNTAIYLSRNNYSKEEIKNELERRFNVDLNFNLEELQHNYRFSSRTSESVPQAICCFLESTSFEDCLRKSISIGGDTDTIAAISCSIAESFYGIPKEIEEKALTYLPNNYKRIITTFYSIINLKQQLLDLEICHDEFWEYMRTRTKRISAPIESGIWGTFFSKDESGKVTDIKILVPEIIDELTLLVNIHEYAHAYELFMQLGDNYTLNKKSSEDYAKSKEKEYLTKKKTYEQS